MKKKTLILLILFIAFIPLATSLTFYVGDEGNLWANCKNLTYVGSKANITVQYPNNTVWIGNQTMTEYSTGQFYYNFTAPQVTGNYLSKVTCNVAGVVSYDDEDFLVKKKEEEMTSLAVVIFMLVITFFILFLPYLKGRFSKSDYVDYAVKSFCYVFGVLLISLDTTMIVTMARIADLGIDSELKFILWMATNGAYFAMLIIVLVFLFKMLDLYKLKKEKKRWGEDEE